jgi:hypothetical protein
MCANCYKMFETAASILQLAHEKEIEEIKRTQKILIEEVGTLEDRIRSSGTGFNEEFKDFYKNIEKLEVLGVLKNKNGNEERDSNQNSRIVQSVESPPKEAPKMMMVSKIHLSPIPERSIFNEEKENSFKTPHSASEKKAKAAPAKITEDSSQVFSKENSPINNAKVQRSTSKKSVGKRAPTAGETSGKKQVPAKQQQSELDKKILLLEKEKKDVLKKKKLNESPTLYSLPRQNNVQSKEGKSLETNTTGSIGGLGDAKHSTTNGKEKSKPGKEKTLTYSNSISKLEKGGGGKIKDKLSLVYRVNTRQLDLDKYDRKKEKTHKKSNSKNSLAQTLSEADSDSIANLSCTQDEILERSLEDHPNMFGSTFKLDINQIITRDHHIDHDHPPKQHVETPHF